MDRRRITTIAFLLLLAGCARLSGCVARLTGDGWAIDRIEERWNAEDAKEDRIAFVNGKSWENLGMQVEKVAELRGPGETRVLAFRALSCVECEPDLLLTIRSTENEKVVTEPFPGKMNEVDEKTGVATGKPFAEIHAYVGKCREGDAAEVIVVDSLALAAGRANRKVIESTTTGLNVVRTEHGIAELLAFKPPYGCREIKGVDRDVEY